MTSSETYEYDSALNYTPHLTSVALLPLTAAFCAFYNPGGKNLATTCRQLYSKSNDNMKHR